VKMVADMGKDADEPLALSISFNRTPTWQVMDQLARDFLVEGRWDKIDSGYQLYALPRSRKAVPALPRMAVPAFSTHGISIAPRVWLSYLSIPVLLGIIYWLSWYHKRQTQQVQAAREPQTDLKLPSSP
jgi:hypothetical protein